VSEAEESVGSSGRPWGVAAALGAAVLVGATLSPAASAAAVAAEGKEVAVQIKDFAFPGKAHEVKVGDTITWTNGGKAAHVAASLTAPAKFKSPKLAAGDSWSFTVPKPGTYEYACALHPKMKATVVALPAAKPVAGAGAGNAALAAAVKPTDGSAGAAEAGAADTEAAADTETVAAEEAISVPGARSAAVLGGTVGALLFLGIVVAAWPGTRSKI
jgi:plastocyanin